MTWRGGVMIADDDSRSRDCSDACGMMTDDDDGNLDIDDGIDGV
jgi:hypothetical protein